MMVSMDAKRRSRHLCISPVADWDICLKRALRSRLQTKCFWCFGFGDFSMSVARIQLMPLCHPWGIFLLTRTKWPPCEIYISYKSISQTDTGIVLEAVILFLSFSNSIRTIFMLLPWLYYVETIFNFKMAATQC